MVRHKIFVGRRRGISRFGKFPAVSVFSQLPATPCSDTAKLIDQHAISVYLKNLGIHKWMILPFEKMEAPSRCADRIGLSIPLPLIPNLTLLMNGWCFCCSKDLQSLLVFILVLLTSYLACRAQDLLKGKLIVEDDFTWIIPSHDSSSLEGFKTEKLKYIGGVDISFLKEDPSTACAALVILDADTLNVVHEEFDVTKLQIPYVPGFLAFREPTRLGLDGRHTSPHWREAPSSDPHGFRIFMKQHSHRHSQKFILMH
ncbi:uncharacterized protein LOC103721183 isoform X7 [Phoenix dactylifera]|uniref:Uncharacterized protein LOC103721183 isoform X7 n=1 Tax=Phoenix dactylifera TaxID=42345 RepID=A0A8B9AL01_PHODC|nr:uncharacterized protein LOC103721183 isoform X7 [Phoenix dactylifera]